MRRGILAVIFGILALSISSTVLAVEADTKGATAGKWTMDLDAATELAKKKELLVLLNFSGSDWCGWCKIMEKNVFSKEEWQTYAKDNVVMVLIDFPKDKTKVPEKFVERNDELKEKYGVRGFPALILLDSDGQTELGRLGAGKEKTPASFISELAPLTRFRAANVAKYVKGLEPKAKAEYLTIVKHMQEAGETIKKKKEFVSAARKAIGELEEKEEKLKASAQEFRASQLGEKELKAYTKLKADLETAEKTLKDWIATGPERSKESNEKYKSMSGTIQELAGKLSNY